MVSKFQGMVLHVQPRPVVTVSRAKAAPVWNLASIPVTNKHLLMPIADLIYCLQFYRYLVADVHFQTS